MTRGIPITRLRCHRLDPLDRLRLFRPLLIHLHRRQHGGAAVGATVINAFADGAALVFGSRLAALVVAALALWTRLPFGLELLVAGTAALRRWWR